MSALSSLGRGGRVVWLVLPWAFLVACSDERGTEDHVPSTPGATQPKGGGALITETEACQKLTAAEKQARDRLSCLDPARQCPEYLRPAGGSSCFKYDSASIDACIQAFDAQRSCPGFEQHPCIVTAVPDAECGTGSAGAAGSAGSGGAAGESGAGGQGDGGTAGEAGAAGSAGAVGLGGLGGLGGLAGLAGQAGSS